MIFKNNTEETYTTRRHIDTLIESNECPFPLNVIPNQMGINLVSVQSIEWVTQKKDKQLVSLTINFKPDNIL